MPTKPTKKELQQQIDNLKNRVKILEEEIIIDNYDKYTSIIDGPDDTNTFDIHNIPEEIKNQFDIKELIFIEILKDLRFNNLIEDFDFKNKEELWKEIEYYINYADGVSKIQDANYVLNIANKDFIFFKDLDELKQYIVEFCLNEQNKISIDTLNDPKNIIKYSIKIEVSLKEEGRSCLK